MGNQNYQRNININGGYTPFLKYINVQKGRETFYIDGLEGSCDVKRLSTWTQYDGMESERFKELSDFHSDHPFQPGKQTKTVFLTHSVETAEKASMLFTNFRTIDVYPEYLLTEDRINGGYFSSSEKQNKTEVIEISASQVMSVCEKYTKENDIDRVSVDEMDGLIPRGAENVLIIFENMKSLNLLDILLILGKDIPNLMVHISYRCKDVGRILRNILWDHGKFEIFKVEEPTEKNLLSTLKAVLSGYKLSVIPPLRESIILDRLREYRGNLFREDDIEKMAIKYITYSGQSLKDYIEGDGLFLKLKDLNGFLRDPLKEKDDNSTFHLLHRENIENLIIDRMYEINMAKINLLRGKSNVFHHNFKFLGNPGTGKTEAARYLAKKLKELGISNGIFKEVSPNALIGKYVGHTGPQTDELCEEVRGGVLFIDEAELLIPSHGRSFNNDAIQSLLKHLEDDSETTFIFATYPEKMNELMKADPGLPSRINYTVKFNDYTNDQLIDIFYSMLHDRGYCTDNEEKSQIEEILNNSIDLGKERLKERFGNARVMRILCEKAIGSFACYFGKKYGNDMENRINELYKPEELITIPADCIKEAAEVLDGDSKALMDKDEHGFKVKVGF